MEECLEHKNICEERKENMPCEEIIVEQMK